MWIYKRREKKKMAIEIINEQAIIDVTDEIERIIKGCVEASLAHEHIDFECEIGITLVDDETIERLNGEFRGINRPTDVLSFPLLDFKGNVRDLTEEDILYDKNRDTGCVMLGDIVISLQRAVDQAREYGHSLHRELGFLTVHGMLHLLGYDHEKDYERQQMREKEERVLERLDLARE